VEYYELTIKIPRPRLAWFRYRVRTLLLLMLLIAAGATTWHLRAGGMHQRLTRKLEQAKIERDVALQQWKRARAAVTTSGDVAESEARAKYFEQRTKITELLVQISRESR
jgi:hypothetical protein